MKWLESITDSMDMNISKLGEIVEDGGAWHAAGHGVSKSGIRLSDWPPPPTNHKFIFHVCNSISAYMWNLPPKKRKKKKKRVDFPGGSDGKESACNSGDLVSIPESGICLGEGNGHPLLYSCLENPMDRGAWQATIHGVAKIRTWLSD